MRKYVVFEGCMGSGKTTAAKMISKHLGFYPLLENFKKHPFPAEFHQSHGTHVLETELLFPIIHFHQISEAKGRNLFSRNVVGDFFLEKDLIFGRANLRYRDDRKAFEDLWNALRMKVPNPDVVFFLDAPTRFLLGRIRKRGRDFERSITFGYVDRLNSAYRRFMKSFSYSSVIRIDAERFGVMPRKESIKMIRDALQLEGL